MLVRMLKAFVTVESDWGWGSMKAGTAFLEDAAEYDKTCCI